MGGVKNPFFRGGKKMAPPTPIHLAPRKEGPPCALIFTQCLSLGGGYLEDHPMTCKCLVMMVIVSPPNWVCSLCKWPKWI